MAETLLALLLVTTSANGSNLIFRWPDFPAPSPRLSRPAPDESLSLSKLDNTWRAAHSHEDVEKAERLPRRDYGLDPDYGWSRPNTLRGRSLSITHSSHHSVSKSPARDRSYSFDKTGLPNEYDHVLGYSAKFLANILCPQRSLCHQKFELEVDDLAFIGHPICADMDGRWRFKPEKIRSSSRGREERDAKNSPSPHPEESTVPPSPVPLSASKSSWLDTFHFVLVLDLPDPSSSASGNLQKYFNILYEQIAFTFTAVLYQEQVVSNFVEEECDKLTSLKESFFSQGEPYVKYSSEALEISSIAPAMKSIFEAIKSSSVAYVSVNYLPLELQLPPHLDALLHHNDDQDIDFIDPFDDDVALNWGVDMNSGWKLPTMAPWKTLLLLDIDNNIDPHLVLGGPHESAEDRTLAEGLIRFLETTSVTLSLFKMADLLDWDLETQVYPIVRWLVLHRRAKLVDVVHPELKTVFAIPPKFPSLLFELATQFRQAFQHPSIPELPQILATVSTSMSKQTDNHFFASVVKSKELIPMYHDVVLWLLKRDLLIALHLRIRVVATGEIKLRVKKSHDAHSLKRKNRISIGENGTEVEEVAVGSAEDQSFFLSPRTAHQFVKRMSSVESARSELSELDFQGREEEIANSYIDEENVIDMSEDGEDSGWDITEDHIGPSMIDDPGKATSMERLWLSAMSFGKDSAIAKRFELINQYFDGKKSDDEILYKANISRKQLREVLHHYDEYLQTFLHPS